MEELITLHYGNFTSLGQRARDFVWCTSCSNHIADRALRTHIFLDEMRRKHPDWASTHKQEWGLSLLECLLLNVASMQKKECWRHSQRSQAEETEETNPEHPSMRTLIGATDDAIIQMAEQVYQEKWALAPSMLSHHQHDDCMRELWQELSQHIARASLQGTSSLRRPSRSRRHSWGCSALQTCSPLQNHEKECCQMAEGRLSSKMIWITEMTIPIEGWE